MMSQRHSQVCNCIYGANQIRVLRWASNQIRDYSFVVCFPVVTKNNSRMLTPGKRSNPKPPAQKHKVAVG
jgi:hypothetical protein